MEAHSLTSALDTRTGVGLEPVRRPEVLRNMAGRRRIWTLEQKLAIVGEMARCGNIAEFARQHDIRTSLLYTWRRELRYALEAGRASHAEPMFVPVMADSPKPLSSDVAIEVEVGGAVVRIGCTAVIGIGPGTRVMVATRPVDFRKGPDALAALVSADYGGDAFPA